jgi:hypothetical protein
MHETIRAAMEGSTARGDQVIRMLNQLLEQISGLSLHKDSGTRVVEEVNDNGRLLDEVPGEDIPQNDELLECVNTILGAIRDKEGIFSLQEVKDLADALVFLLETVASDQSIIPASKSMSTCGHQCEIGTKRDVADLRRNLVAVKGIILSSRSISVNKPSKCQTYN